MLAALLFPGIAAAQGILVRTFHGAADFTKALRLQRLAKSDKAFALPVVPKGIPGFYDPATRTFTIAAGSPFMRPIPAPQPAQTSAADGELCAPPGQARVCGGSIDVRVAVNTISPGIKPGDTVFCNLLVDIGRYRGEHGGVLPDDTNGQSTNFGVGQSATVTMQYYAVYSASEGGYIHFELETKCSIPNASDGKSYGPNIFDEIGPAELGPSSTSAILNF